MATKDVIIHPKNAVVLTCLKDEARKWYAGSLARHSGLSYVYVTKLIGIFEKDGVVAVKKEGKVNRVSLTEKGHKIAAVLDDLAGKLSALAGSAQDAPSAKSEEKKPEKG